MQNKQMSMLMCINTQKFSLIVTRQPCLYLTIVKDGTSSILAEGCKGGIIIKGFPVMTALLVPLKMKDGGLNEKKINWDHKKLKMWS